MNVYCFIYKTSSQEHGTNLLEDYDTIMSYNCILNIFTNWYSSQVSEYDTSINTHSYAQKICYGMLLINTVDIPSGAAS